MNKRIKSVSILSLVSALCLGGNVYADNTNLDMNNGELTSSVKLLEDSKLPRADSNGITKTVNGITYTFRTSAHSDLAGVYGMVKSTANKTMPAGYISGHANLYNSSGSVVQTANWYTNPSATTYYANTTPRNYKAGRYFTKGTVRLYNGGGYNTYGANPSPEVTYGMYKFDISESELEKRQAIYDTKNMISAIGVNEVEGYVSVDDLYDTENLPSTPEETIALQEKMAKQGQKSIPLYAEDGETVIGEYIINCSTENI